MVFSILGLTKPTGTTISTNYLHNASGIFNVYLRFSSPMVLEKILNDPTLFLHFSDHLSFEKDPVLYLYKLKPPSSKDDFYQV
jgi:hypothetical protein